MLNIHFVVIYLKPLNRNPIAMPFRKDSPGRASAKEYVHGEVRSLAEVV
jgi:hypothetical protein